MDVILLESLCMLAYDLNIKLYFIPIKLNKGMTNDDDVVTVKARRSCSFKYFLKNLT